MISVVVPIYNEEENLPELRRRVAAALDSIPDESWELVLVNDGSRDSSLQIMRRMNAEDPRIKVVNLSRNFGHQPAVTAGIHHARGDCVVLIDGDLQDPPEVIPEMVARWRDGARVVLGERRSRGDVSGARGVGFRLFYPVFRRISDLPTVPDAGIFGLMDRRVVDEFNKLPERNRFIPGLRSWLGFEQATVLYDRNDRAAGKPKQTLRRLVRYAMDGMISFSYKPLRAATYLGFVVAVMGFVTALVFIVRRLIGHEIAVTGFTTLLTMMMFLGGVQLICIGIVGEYIGRIYEESKQRPLYVVQDAIGFNS
jgi:glycosyltransferase involved in cell wall biosynthesis